MRLFSLLPSLWIVYKSLPSPENSSKTLPYSRIDASSWGSLTQLPIRSDVFTECVRRRLSGRIFPLCLMSTREIQGHLEEMYGVEVGPTLISNITDGVVEQAKAWQNRALESFYAVVFLDALCVKMRHEGRVENRVVYVAIGINLEGRKDVLGLWTGASEGAKFWLGVLTELRNRGVRTLTWFAWTVCRAFPRAIGSVFPLAQVQLCIVHLVRNSLN